MLNIFTKRKTDNRPDGAERSTTDGGAGSCAPDAPKPHAAMQRIRLKRGAKPHDQRGGATDDRPLLVISLPAHVWDGVLELLKERGERPTRTIKNALDEYLSARGMGRQFADSERADGEK